MNRTNSPSANRRNYYSRYIAHYTKRYNSLLALGGLFLAGVLLGALVFRTAGGDTMDLLLRMVNGFVENRRGQSLMENFTSGTISSLVFLAVLFVCGFCAIAQPFIVVLPLFRGLGIGFSIASLYAAYGVSAIGFVALLMLPGTVLTTLAILVSCRESLRLSVSLFMTMWGDRKEDSRYSVRLYFARYVACCVVCVVSAFMEAALYFGFANLFVFG